MTYKKCYDEKELKRLVESGKTRKKIAETLGISESAVDVGIKQQGLVGKNSRKKYSEELLEKYLEEGKTSREIAELMGVAKETVNRWIKKGKLKGAEFKRIGPKTAKAMELAKQGYTAQEISNLTGTSISVAYIAIKRIKEEKKTNADRHLCKMCKYRGKVSGCDYYLLTGIERLPICEVEECTVFDKGERLGESEG